MTRATNASPDASSKPTRKKRVTFHFHIEPRAPPVESRVKLTNARTHFSVATGNLSNDAGSLLLNLILNLASINNIN